jgi:ArsR family transcriptional regulator
MIIEDFQIKVFKALGHPVRFAIVKKLLEGERCVCQLQEDVDFSQSNLSQHLKILKNSGILSSEKKGLNVHYKIKRNEIVEVIKLVESFVKKDILDIAEGMK